MTTPDAGPQANVLELLHQSPFLENLSKLHLKTLSTFAEVLEVQKGERIFREGDLANAVYLIVHGRVVLEICAAGIGCKQICTLTGGELLGWSPLLDQVSFTATARTLEPTQLIRLDADALRQACRHDMSLGYDFLKRTSTAMDQRLSATRLQLIDVYGTQMTHAVDRDAASPELGGPR